MKKFIANASAMIVFILLFQTANATIRRVGFSGNFVPGVDYLTLQEAHNASTAGDTIQLYPGTWTASISKQVVLLSKGYFTEGEGANPNLQVIAGDVIVTLTMLIGSDNSVIEGVSGGNMYVYTYAINGVQIKRCKLTDIRFDGQVYKNWQINQCFIEDAIWMNNSAGAGRVENLNVTNSYIANIDLSRGASSGMSGQLTNNVFGTGYPTHYFGNGSFLLLSNIFIGASTSFDGTTNCNFQNNLAQNASLLPAGNGNTNGVNMAATFVGYPTQGTFSNDGRYALKNPGPGKGSGYGGTDCGIFGGSAPYHLSGIPSIPSFYKLTAPSIITSGNPYTITFSVRSNN